MRYSKLFACIMLVNFLMQSCSTSHKINASNHLSSTDEIENNWRASENTDFATELTEEYLDRKLVVSATIALSVENTDTTNSQLEKIAKTYDGYVNEMSNHITILRIKAKHLEEALDRISILGNVKSINRFGQDVTEEYLDYQILCLCFLIGSLLYHSSLSQVTLKLEVNHFEF